MRIAVVAPPWLPVPPVAYGGTELVLDNLCRGLAAAGHDVLLCTTGDSTCPVERAWTYERHLGVANVSPATELHHAIDAHDTAAEWGADVVHDHTIGGPVWAQLHSRVPVVTTNHGPFAPPLDVIYRRLARHLPVVAISHHQASTANDIPIARVIHHGIDLSQVAVGDGAGGYALFLGRMNPDKGIDAAIDIARRAGLPLRIAAKMQEPAELAYFRECIEPRLGAGVEYVGEVGGAVKQALLRDAVCLLNPISWAEPFGMVMIEALACGTPVVSTPLGAAPEIVEHGVSGFLGRSVDELGALVGRAAGLRRDACRRRVERAFSMARMAADHVELYDSLVARSHAAEAELTAHLSVTADLVVTR